MVLGTRTAVSYPAVPLEQGLRAEFDHTVTDADTAAKLVADLIADHREHLPQFA